MELNYMDHSYFAMTYSKHLKNAGGQFDVLLNGIPYHCEPRFADGLEDGGVSVCINGYEHGLVKVQSETRGMPAEVHTCVPVGIHKGYMGPVLGDCEIGINRITFERNFKIMLYRVNEQSVLEDKVVPLREVAAHLAIGYMREVPDVMQSNFLDNLLAQAATVASKRRMTA